MKKISVDVIDDPEKPIEKKILAEAIVDVSKALKKLGASGLNRRAIIVLIYDSIPAPKYPRNKTSKGEIGDILDALETLKDRYTGGNG